MNKQGVKIGIIGPESTGKTLLAKKLAEYYKGEWIPEYARTYMENLDRPYTFEDVVHIAQWLVDAWEKRKSQVQPVFFDTEMIIVKVWLEVAFGKVPKTMEYWLKEMDFDAYLLCYYDLPWVYDPVRENPGKMRQVLFDRYENEITKLQKPYAIVSGKGIDRIINAADAIGNITQLHNVKHLILNDPTLPSSDVLSK